MARNRPAIRLEQEFQEQASRRDPFQSPRMQTARRAGAAPLQPEVDPFSREQMREEPELPVAAAEGQAREQETLRDFLSQSDPQEQERLLKSRVPRKLRQLNLGDIAEGLSFDQMGRMNLILRLRERFGDDFFSNESARNAVSIFDEALREQGTEEEEEMEAMLSRTDATLEELLRLQRRMGRG